MKIAPATTPQDIVAVRRLFEDYAATLAISLCFQGFGAELAGLPGAYAAPRGRLYLATVDGVPAGCVAMRPHDAQNAEMKRLYVRAQFQGRGIGLKLAEQVIADARALGYASLLLDTLPSMQTALRLYDTLGFVRRGPYFDTPVAENIFMELKLGGPSLPTV